MVADEPIEPELLAQLLEVSPDAGRGAVRASWPTAYEAEDRGFVLVRVAGGYRFQSHPDLAPYVERFVLEGQSARLSAAALETLAIVAYKQPVSPGPGGGHPRRQRRRRDAHAAAARATSRRSAATPGPARPCSTAPRATVPREAGPRLARRPAAAGRLRARPRGRRGARARAARLTATDRTSRAAGDGERLQKVLARAGLRQPAGLRGPDRRRAGDGQRRGRRSRPAGRPRDRRGRGRRRARVGSRRASSTTCSTSRRGVVTTAADPQGRPTVVELVPPSRGCSRSGRLDADTEGLLLLTNDGDLTHRSPIRRFGVEKEYLAEVEGEPVAGRAPPAARGRRARGRRHRAGQGGAGRAERAAPHDPRGPQPPGAAHVRGGRPPRASAWCAPASARSPTAACKPGEWRPLERRRGAGAGEAAAARRRRPDRHVASPPCLPSAPCAARPRSTPTPTSRSTSASRRC